MARPTPGVRDSHDEEPSESRCRMTLLLQGSAGDEDMERDEFLQHCRNDPDRLFDLIKLTCDGLRDKQADLEAEVAERELKHQELEAEIIVNANEIRVKETSIRDLTAERDQYAVQIARLTSTAPGASPTRRSAKIPDPPMLSDGENPRFDDWLLLMNQKLTANADHFDTPALRIAYVASRCEGKAAKHIAQRLRDGARNRYSDSDEILEHLKQIYGDPNRVIAAKQKFRDLMMKPTDKFHDFLSEFFYLAGEAEVNEDDWKSELYHRLTIKMQELTIPESVRASGTFQEFSDYCSQTANRLEVITNRRQRNRTANDRFIFSSPSLPASATAADRSFGRAATPRDSRIPAVKVEENNQARPRMDQDVRNRHFSGGLCFKCHKAGHLAKDCLGSAGTTALQALEKENDMEKFPQGSGKEEA